MENPKSEVYIEEEQNGSVLVDIFSHQKKEWVYHGPVKVSDVLPLFKDLQIRADNTLINIFEGNVLFNALKAARFHTKHFRGMSGKYRVIDGSIYELCYQAPREPPRKNRVLMASCIESVTKTDKPFKVEIEDIQRNLRHNTWTKI